VGFFLTLVIGVMFPEVKANLAATNFLIRQELATHREEIQKLLTEQLQNSLKDPALHDLIKQGSISPNSTK
jgi:hypothetical protein